MGRQIQQAAIEEQGTPMDIELARFNMIAQTIRPAVALDPQTIETLLLVRRERFVPAALQDLAFADTALPLPGGETMLKPEVIGRILQAIAPQRGESILLIGAGSGYLAALIAVHADSVHCIELNPEIAALATANLDRASVGNVTVEEGDGLGGCAECAPYDLIVVTGSVEAIPAAWLDQLKPAGRLFAFVGKAPVMHGRLVRRVPGAGIVSKDVFETSVAPLRAQTPAPFVF